MTFFFSFLQPNQYALQKSLNQGETDLVFADQQLLDHHAVGQQQQGAEGMQGSQIVKLPTLPFLDQGFLLFPSPPNISPEMNG